MKCRRCDQKHSVLYLILLSPKNPKFGHKGAYVIPVLWPDVSCLLPIIGRQTRSKSGHTALSFGTPPHSAGLCAILPPWERRANFRKKKKKGEAAKQTLEAPTLALNEEKKGKERKEREKQHGLAFISSFISFFFGGGGDESTLFQLIYCVFQMCVGTYGALFPHLLW